MTTLADIIAQADEMLLSEMVEAILMRYEQLRPDWQICYLALEKKGDLVEQIDRTIGLLEHMKNM